MVCNLARPRCAFVLAAALLAASCESQAISEPTPTPQKPAARGFTADQRAAALRSARVWRKPAAPIGQVDFKINPVAEDGFPADVDVSCAFTVEPVTGTTPKFNCRMPNGDVLKVKYGKNNPELFAEVAASRLLSALGFGADRMFLVPGVKCAGCPAFPFQSLKCLAETGLQSPCFPRPIDPKNVSTVKPAVIERRLRGEKVEATEDQGWAWYELEHVQEKAGGSPLAEVDAFRLMAVFLAHWDNKAENQRLLCVDDARHPDGSCAKPLAYIQDLGGTFGPTKVDLRNWQAFGVFRDAKSCTVSMKSLPFGGATFGERRISESGRKFLLDLLQQLSTQQVSDLFTGSGITTYDHPTSAGRDPRAWTAAFFDKIRQIREAGPCR